MNTSKYTLLASLVFIPVLSFAQGTPWPDWNFSIGAYPQPGFNGIAVGNYSFSSYQSFAFGENAWAGWQRSVAMGFSAVAHEESISVGSYAYSYDGAVSLGYDANSYYYSVAVGVNASAQGYRSIALGYSTNASPESSVAIGDRAFSMSFGGVALGRGNSGKTKANAYPVSIPAGGDPIFMVGNAPVNWSGLDATRSNALTVYRDGDAHLAGVLRVKPAGDIPMTGYQSTPVGIVYP